MHKDVVDNVVCAVKSDFVVTTSLDGNLKFWKKNFIGIEFVKQYKAHQGKITGVAISNSGSYLSTCSSKDESLKIFDILNFDMIHFVKLKFVPFQCEFVSKINDPCILIALSEKDSSNIHLVKSESKGEIYKTIKLHEFPVTAFKFNENFNCVLSIDTSGMIEYWDVDSQGMFIFIIIFPTCRPSKKYSIRIQRRNRFI